VPRGDILTRTVRGDEVTSIRRQACAALAVGALLPVLAGASRLAFAQTRPHELPAWAESALRRSPLGSRVAIDAWIEPHVQEADFDGDGQGDAAVLVRERGSRKAGIAIVHRRTSQVFIIGAGTALSNGGDDFSWMDTWRVVKGTVEQGATGELPPAFRGAALWVEKAESASAVLYWTGTRYAWYQQGD
jgi:hypothetical protein